MIDSELRSATSAARLTLSRMQFGIEMKLLFSMSACVSELHDERNLFGISTVSVCTNFQIQHGFEYVALLVFSRTSGDIVVRSMCVSVC